MDRIGIGGSDFESKRGAFQYDTPGRHRIRYFFSAEAPVRKATVGFSQGEDEPEGDDLRDCQNNRYSLEHVFDHDFLS